MRNRKLNCYSFRLLQSYSLGRLVRAILQCNNNHLKPFSESSSVALSFQLGSYIREVATNQRCRFFFAFQHPLLRPGNQVETLEILNSLAENKNDSYAFFLQPKIEV